MQPYLFPYIGYFQLVNCVDKYVIYDDVNFIKRGWINRNRILVNKNEHLFTLELLEISCFKPINVIKVGSNQNKLFKTIQRAYSKAPFFDSTIDLVKSLLFFSDDNLAKYLTNSIIEISRYLNIKSEILISSQIKKDNSLHGQDKIINICQLLGGNEYINAIGGQDLYSKSLFETVGISLRFLKTKPIQYKQFSNPFMPNMSIIDVMMFNSKEEISGMLTNYELC